MVSRYHKVHRDSLDDPAGFWGAAAEHVHWYKTWDKVLDDSHRPFYRWFTGGEINTCYNALDRHVENGRAEQAALIYDSPVTQTLKSSRFASFATRSQTSQAPSPRSASRKAFA